jgi:hypothetical protein
MDIHFEMVRGANELQALLKGNGWQLDPGSATHLTARHAEVHDQPTARNRLLQMGLLTSNRLRIEFGPSTN